MTDANRRTSINLDEETYEIAKRLGNRSEFVRECLRRWHAWDTGAHVHPTNSDKCFPLSRKGCSAGRTGRPLGTIGDTTSNPGAVSSLGRLRKATQSLPMMCRTTTNGLSRRQGNSTNTQSSPSPPTARSTRLEKNPLGGGIWPIYGLK